MYPPFTLSLALSLFLFMASFSPPTFPFPSTRSEPSPHKFNFHTLKRSSSLQSYSLSRVSYSTLCRYHNKKKKNNNNDDGDRRWDYAIHEVVRNALRSFDDYVNSYLNQPKEGKDVVKRVDVVERESGVDVDDWDWDRWRKHFGEVDEQERIVSILKDVDKDSKLSMKEYSSSESQQKVSQLKKRVVFGLGIGISVGGVVLAGGWVFSVALAAAVFVGAREYFELVRSRGITAGMTPPPRYVSRVCSVICALMPILTLYFGHIDVSLTSAAFVVAMTLLLQRGNPRFAQLSSAIFGLFYCGYLPCFWVKLRCGLAAPALHTGVASTWPILLGGRTHWTVGLVATLISISNIIAADTFAFLGGKAFGRTPLTNISPKKTWEGAVAGLGGCIATSILLSKIFCWPTTLPSSIAFGFLNFFGSLFGDLIESMIKRDAGVKDSGSLIPGHGGILDRVDSYIFTGALAYSFVKTFLPLYGV